MELKGFAKVDLKPGEKTDVSIELDKRAFAYYNTDIKDWYVESGEFEILVGASSRDIRLTGSVEVHSSQPSQPSVDNEKFEAYANFPKGGVVSKQEFEKLLGKESPQNLDQKKGEYDINTPIGDMTDFFIARQLYKFLNKQMGEMIEGLEGTPTAVLLDAMGREMPLRSVLMMGAGPLNREMLDALLIIINGKFFKGLGALIRAARNK